MAWKSLPDVCPHPYLRPRVKLGVRVDTRKVSLVRRLSIYFNKPACSAMRLERRAPVEVFVGDGEHEGFLSLNFDTKKPHYFLTSRSKNGGLGFTTSAWDKLTTHNVQMTSCKHAWDEKAKKLLIEIPDTICGGGFRNSLDASLDVELTEAAE